MMTTWESPNGVTHLVPDTGPCATCGRSHKEDLIIAAIAEGLLDLAGGDPRKAQILAAAYLPNGPVGFGDATTPNPPWYGQTDYAEDWSLCLRLRVCLGLVRYGSVPSSCRPTGKSRRSISLSSRAGAVTTGRCTSQS